MMYNYFIHEAVLCLKVANHDNQKSLLFVDKSYILSVKLSHSLSVGQSYSLCVDTIYFIFRLIISFIYRAIIYVICEPIIFDISRPIILRFSFSNIWTIHQTENKYENIAHMDGNLITSRFWIRCSYFSRLTIRVFRLTCYLNP